MSSLNDGGPAFPVVGKVETVELFGVAREVKHDPQPGMSLRDYFAAAALQGMWSNSAIVDNFSCHTFMAREAYNAADAMLAARAEGGAQ